MVAIREAQGNGCRGLWEGVKEAPGRLATPWSRKGKQLRSFGSLSLVEPQQGFHCAGKEKGWSIQQNKWKWVTDWLTVFTGICFLSCQWSLLALVFWNTRLRGRLFTSSWQYLFLRSAFTNSSVLIVLITFKVTKKWAVYFFARCQNTLKQDQGPTVSQKDL